MKIECTFGPLKETFNNLKGLRITVARHRGHKLACEWITACVIVYKIIKGNLEPFEIKAEDDFNAEHLSSSNDVFEPKRFDVFDFLKAS